MKDLDLFFTDKNGSTRKLKPFPFTHTFVIKEMRNIVKAYENWNLKRLRFKEPVMLTVKPEIFDQIKADLRFPITHTNRIMFLFEHAWFFSLEAEVPDVEPENKEKCQKQSN